MKNAMEAVLPKTGKNKIQDSLLLIGQRMSEHLRDMSKCYGDDKAFLLSQEWDLKRVELDNACRGGLK